MIVENNWNVFYSNFFSRKVVWKTFSCLFTKTLNQKEKIYKLCRCVQRHHSNQGAVAVSRSDRIRTPPATDGPWKFLRSWQHAKEHEWTGRDQHHDRLLRAGHFCILRQSLWPADDIAPIQLRRCQYRCKNGCFLKSILHKRTNYKLFKTCHLNLL